MGLRLADTTGLVRELAIVDEFKVKVRHLARRDLEQLIRRLDGLDDEAAALESVTTYLAGWSGLTPAAARKLGVPIADDQPTTGGEIPFDADTARDLWRHAYADQFMNRVIRFSRLILEAIDEEKRRAKNAFGASSAPSTTP